MTTIKFETGKTYQTRFITDSDLRVKTTITKRTEKTVWFKTENGETGSKRVSEYNGSEFILPFGSYSMAPMCRAENQA